LTARLALLFDYAEEGWPSMDLSAEMLLRGLADPALGLHAERVCPPFRHRATRVPLLGRRGAAFNADRVLNRFRDYPRHVRRIRSDFDLFHVCDHSYAQLVHELPVERCGVYCHDLDAFRCLLEPPREPRPRWFRALARRCLGGLQKAAVVFHSTLAVRRQIEAHGLVDPARLVHAPYGIADEFHPDTEGATPPRDGPFLLHVGSCIPRKRIDVLLDVFAALRSRFPGLRLVKVGAAWSPAQQAQIERLGLAGVVVPYNNLARAEVAALYRSASVVLLPSEAEGFGLPVIEALACGAVVVASDLPVLREVGGPAAVYCPVGDVAAWAEVVSRVLTDLRSAPLRPDRLAWARRFSWAAHARTVAEAYQRLR
jgi:glycosyltransferase involved in cell wall biosynthesis